MASLSTNGVVLSNTVNEELGFTISAKNQLGDDFGGTIKSVEVIPNSTSDEAKKLYVGAVNSDDEYTFNAFRGEVAANKVAKGSYGFTVKIKDSNDNVVSLGLTVTVQEPSGTTPNYYRVETDKTSYDMKSGDEISTAKVKLTAYSYTSAGVKIAKLNVSDFVMTVTDADGADVTSSISGSAISLVKKTTIATGSSVYASPAPTGVWLIKGTKYQGTDVKVQPVSFEVKNTQPAVVKSVNKLVTSKATNDLAGIIDDCFSFSVGDKTLTSTDILGNISVDVVTATLSNGVDISFKTIYIYEEVKAGEYIRHKVDMGGVVVKTAQ